MISEQQLRQRQRTASFHKLARLVFTVMSDIQERLIRPENERDYGQEAIEMLLQVMENQRDDLVVILAGYRERMDVFFQANPGFRSRIGHHIDFPDYTHDELMRIADLILSQQQYAFDDESRRVFAEYLDKRMRQPHFSNARSGEHRPHQCERDPGVAPCHLATRCGSRGAA